MAVQILKLIVYENGYTYVYQVECEETQDQWCFSFPFDGRLVDAMRQFEKRKWDKNRYCHVVPRTERNEYVFNLMLGYKDSPYLSPISNLYTDDSSRLFKHQQEGIDFILNKRRCMLGFEMGLGKTLTTIRAMDWLADNRKVYHWWLVAPFGAQKEWQRQMFTWGARTYFKQTTTYESLNKLIKSWPGDLIPQGVVFDESVKIKNPVAARSKAAYELCHMMRDCHGHDSYIIQLSGCPAPKSPEDWWHQIECLRPGWMKESNLRDFRKRYATVVKQNYGYGEFDKVIEWRKDEVEKLGKRISPLVLVKHKEDCLDLPDKIYEIIECPPTAELLRTANVLVSIAETAIKALELTRELSDGFQYTDEGTVEIDSPKLAVVQELLDFYSTENGGPGRLVIFAPFHASIDRLVKVCTENEWKACSIDGRGWSDKNILEKFESDLEDNIVIVANPACVHGLTLSKTQALVYYSNNFSVDARIQSEDRRDRPGMDVSKGTRVVDICHLPTDKYILDRLKQGRDIQGITLDEIKEIWAGAR